MGKVLLMALLSLRKYAASRKARGLAGGSPAGVKRAIDSGRIVRKSDGRIDQDQADLDWLRNTQERCPADGSRSTAKTGIDGRREAPARGDRAAEFRRGADWLLHRTRTTARKLWPEFIEENFSDMLPSNRVRIVELLCGTLETWPGVELPGPDGAGDFFGGAKMQAAAIVQNARRVFPRLAAEVFAPAEIGRASCRGRV